MFVSYSAECEYQKDFRTDDKDIEIATLYHPTRVMNHNKIKKFEKDGFCFYKIDKLTIITSNSIKNFEPVF